MKRERDDFCVCCGKPIAAEGLGLLCYYCSKDTDEAPERYKEQAIVLTASRAAVKQIKRLVSQSNIGLLLPDQVD